MLLLGVFLCDCTLSLKQLKAIFPSCFKQLKVSKSFGQLSHSEMQFQFFRESKSKPILVQYIIYFSIEINEFHLDVRVPQLMVW